MRTSRTPRKLRVIVAPKDLGDNRRCIAALAFHEGMDQIAEERTSTGTTDGEDAGMARAQKIMAELLEDFS